MSEPVLRYSVEALTHFQCARCLRWWSIGDPSPEQQGWYCPWCGRHHWMIYAKPRSSP